MKKLFLLLMPLLALSLTSCNKEKNDPNMQLKDIIGTYTTQVYIDNVFVEESTFTISPNLLEPTYNILEWRDVKLLIYVKVSYPHTIQIVSHIDRIGDTSYMLASNSYSVFENYDNNLTYNIFLESASPTSYKFIHFRMK